MKYVLMVSENIEASLPMHKRKKYERNHSFTTFKYLGEIEILNHCYAKEFCKALEKERQIRQGLKVEHKKKFIAGLNIPIELEDYLFNYGELISITQKTISNNKYTFILSLKL